MSQSTADSMEKQQQQTISLLKGAGAATCGASLIIVGPPAWAAFP